jgi:hypothetical protein
MYFTFYDMSKDNIFEEFDEKFFLCFVFLCSNRCGKC